MSWSDYAWSRKIHRRVVRLNRRVHDGWLVLESHPIFGIGGWVVFIEAGHYERKALVKLSYGSAREALDAAERELDRLDAIVLDAAAFVGVAT